MSFDAQFWVALLQIIGVNIILSGDNAVVIALACRALPPRQQKLGIAFGASAAVVLRVILTLFIAYLLTIPYLNIAGGLLLLWIGYRLMVQEDEDAAVDSASSLIAAIRIVVIADLVMSLDNVIAVAAAAHGNILLLVLGLVISVPLVVYGATLLIALIRRFPVIVPGGAALIGYVGGEILLTDPMLAPWVDAHAHWLRDLLPLLAAVGVVLIGRIRVPLPQWTEAQILSEEAGAAALTGGRVLLQIAGRVLASRAAIIFVFFASLLGYGLEAEATRGLGTLQESMSALHAARPVLAAVIAIGLGETRGRLICRRRQAQPD
jgi:YjbE family integral membrane protein